MLSPFPGMDPYIEASGLFEDFHITMIGEIQRALAPVVPDRYTVRAGERSYIVLSSGPEDEKHFALPDVSVFTPRRLGKSREGESGGVAVVEAPIAEKGPIRMRALVTSEYREPFVEIRTLRPEHKLVTCIEILSPSNKRYESPGWNLYLRKRQSYLEGSVHLVEIDLLRNGQRMPMENDWPASPYYVLVSRKEESPDCTVWPAHFSSTLPEIGIPLLRPDPDVPLALQPLVDAVYARSRYERDIDYRQPLAPPLSVKEVAWLRRRLRQRAQSQPAKRRPTKRGRD